MRKKTKLLECIIADTNPDIIVGTETWLDPTIKNSELLPPSLGYDVLRRDRPRENLGYDVVRGDRPNHGGVLLAIKSSLEPEEVKSSPAIELLTTEFKANKKKVRISAFYRPPNLIDEDYLETVKQEFQKISKRNKNTVCIIAGDFNLPDIDWKSLAVTGHQYPSRVNKTFLEVIANNNLEQIVDFPTRKDNTLDLVLTTHPSFKARCKPMPSIGSSDHDIVLLDTNIFPTRPKPIRRTIHLWKKADTEGIKKDLANLADDINPNTKDVNTVWLHLKERILETIKNRVPQKKTSSRHTNPWMNTDIKRTIKRKQRADKKSRKTHKGQFQK